MVDAQIPKWNSEKINNEIENRIKDISIFWKKSSIAPTVKPEVIDHWDNLLEEWATDKSLPLYVRKRSGTILYGEVNKHSTGRDLVLTDNYPALWSFVSAYRGERPSIADIKRKIKDDEIPIAMGIKRNDPRVEFKCTMKRDPNWRYCHINGLELREREGLFRKFLSKR
jgi:hypothetical protein